jgi:hypothetical protein
MNTHHWALRANGLLTALLLLLASAAGLMAQDVATSTVPIVTIQATDNHGTWAGDPAAFTVFRSGNTVPALNVYCCISGTASNGVDYQSIGNFVPLSSGVTSNTVVIHPVNLGQTDIRTVTLDLCPSPLMTPVNYSIGSPSSATAFIAPAGVSNIPPAVALVNPTNGAVYQAPANITLIAKATDPDGTVSNVEFFANNTDLGRGQQVVLDPPPGGGVSGLVYIFNWQSIPTNIYSLTAVATDDGGLATTSAPVKISVVAGPPPTNHPPIVRIISPPNGAIFRAPVTIPIYAFAFDLDGTVASVEFFADGSSLGFGHHVSAVPPPSSASSVLYVTPTNYWVLLWTNPPVKTNISLTAQATDDGGASAISDPVLINVLPSPPPPTNRPPIITIVATDPIAIEGTNCWPWIGLVGPTATWSNWISPTATYRLFTNCGPKNATCTVFRFGATNDSLDVSYAIGGTATNGVDYVALPGLVTIPAGERRAAITIVPLDDGPPDITSSVVLKLAPGTNYVLGYPRAAAAIILDSESPRPVTGITPGATFNFAAAGPDGAWFRVETSADMIHWTPVCTNQVVNGTIDFVDPDPTTKSALFYRTMPETGPPMQ